MRIEISHSLLKLKILEVYFEPQADLTPIDIDIVKFIQCDARDDKTNNFITSTISLAEDVDVIKSKFKKTLRYDINKAYRYTFDYREVQDITEVVGLQDKLDTFLKSKNLQPSNKKKIKDFFSRGRLYISILQDGDTGFRNYHFYIRDNGCKRARLWYSFSDRNSSTAYDLNKVHIFEDISFFKASGISNFDLGGISSVTNPSGIDKFKLAFSGDIEYSFTGAVGTSWRGRFFLAIYNALSRYRLLFR